MDQRLDAVAAELRLHFQRSTRDATRMIDEAVRRLLDGCHDRERFTRYADVCIDASFHLFEIGETKSAIAIATQLSRYASQFQAPKFERRILSILGGQHADVADYPKAMSCFKSSIEIARRLKDPIGEAACINNAAATLQDMGHHREAIELANRSLKIRCEGEHAPHLWLHASSLGLFSAYRLKEKNAAQAFLESGERNLLPTSRALGVAFFERNRSLYLIDAGRASDASSLIETALTRYASAENPRVMTLLRLAQATCAWGNLQFEEAQTLISALYDETSVSRLYHPLVLQGALKIYSDPASEREAEQGLRFARELVEFTTKVKRAKFYRQLAKVSVRDVSSEPPVASTFGVVTDFKQFIATSVGADERELADSGGDILKHEELTAIHDDIASLRVARLRGEIKTAAVSTAENWAIAAEFFDDETGKHCFRVGHLAGMLAREIGLGVETCIQIEHAARLHDIGKIAVNEVILLKPGRLDAAEMSAMRLHTEIGAQILQGSDDPTLKMATDIARHHHEWWNGAGYPRRLIGRAIPLSARICAYADVYDALTHERVYKRAWTHEQAMDEFERLKTTQFDPDLFQPFTKVIEAYRTDLVGGRIAAFADMDSNALITSRKSLMDTIAAPQS